MTPPPPLPQSLLAQLVGAARLEHLSLPFRSLSPPPESGRWGGGGARVREGFVRTLLGSAPVKTVDGRGVSIKERVAAVSVVRPSRSLCF